MEAKQQRIDMFRRFKENGEEGSIQEKGDALYHQYQAKLNYLKQYHGSHFDELFQRMTQLRIQVMHSEDKLTDDLFQRYNQSKKDLFLDGNEI
jgi:hypothetical protein